ncbi:MAG: hypothetical protein WCP16_21545 [Pseudanabaena sp. ELA645]
MNVSLIKNKIIRDRLTNRHLLFLNRSLAQSRQKVTELLDTNIEAFS